MGDKITLCVLLWLLAPHGKAQNSSSINDTLEEDSRQPRATGRIVKLYSGYKPDPVHCVSEGFQADPKDCAIFYRCTKSEKGKFTVFRFQCGPGTVYDPETEICNHPQRTKRSECGGTVDSSFDNNAMNEIGAAQQELPSQISTKVPVYSEQTTIHSTHSTIVTSSKIPDFTTVTASTIAPVISSIANGNDGTTSSYGTNQFLSSSTARPENNLATDKPYGVGEYNNQKPDTTRDTCTTDGFMGDSVNCHKFYRCVRNYYGGFTRYEFSCSESTIWDDDLQSCNHPWAVKRSRCGRNQSNGDSGNALPDKTSTPNVNTKHNEKVSDKTIQQQIQISYGSDVSQTQTQIGHNVGVQNQTQINYGDRINNNKNTIENKQNQTQISHGSAVSQTQTQINYGDKVVQTQVQIDHSQQSSQTQTQVSVSTTKSSTMTPFYNTEEQKTTPINVQNDNVCTQSGFMGDPNNCKIFYRCVDNGKGGYTKHEFSCGDGTLWDRKLEACNHAWAVSECGENKSPTQTDDATSTTIYMTTTPSYSSSAKTTESYSNVTNNNNVPIEPDNQHNTDSTTPSTQSTTPISTTIDSSVSKNNDCTTSGFIGDRNDCKIFYRCVDDGRGGFIKHEFECGEGTLWDPDIESCNHAHAVKNCGGNTNSNTHNTSLENSKTTVPPIAMTSTTTSTTTEDKISTEIYVPNYSIPNEIVTSSTDKAVQDNKGSNKCNSTGFMGDNYDCKKFYRCVDNGDSTFTRHEFYCGEGTAWDSRIESCNHEVNVPNCGNNQVVTVKQETVHTTTVNYDGNNSTYASQPPISSSTTTYETTEMTTTLRSSSETVNSGNICKNSGFIGDMNDCKKFYRCVDNGDGSYTQHEFACGEGTVWDQNIEGCNHAWAVETCGNGSPNNYNTSTTAQSTTASVQNTQTSTVYETTTHPTSLSDGKEHHSTKDTTKTTTEMPSRNPAGSNDNNCTSEGFHRNPNNCKMFYRCVDNGDGKFIKYDFKCGEGTIWNQEIQSCDHESNDSKCSTESVSYPSDSTESQQGVESSSSTKKEVQHTTEKVPGSTSSAPDSTECTNEGFYADQNNCQKFFRCVSDGDGSYTKYEFTCAEGTIWIQDIQACDHDNDRNECSTQHESTSEASGKSQSTTGSTHTTQTSSSTTIAENEEEYYYEYSEESETNGPNCTSEGYYGDQQDCRKFYRCVDNGSGGLTKYEFTCGEGTAWDDEIKGCNHIHLVKGCNNNSISSTQSSVPDEGNYSTTETLSSTQATNTSGSDAGESPNDNNHDDCKEQGFYGSTSDCKKFYRCVDNGEGGYTKYDFTCGEGTIWDQDKTTCNHPQDVSNPSCGPDKGESTTTSSSQTKSTSSVSSTTQSASTTSSTANAATQTSTSTTQKGQQTTQPSQEQTSKQPENANITCTKAGYFANPNDCKKFYRCVDWNGDGSKFSVFHFDCGEGTIWDPALDTCNHEESVYPPRDCTGTQSDSATSEGTTTEESTTSTTEESTQSTTAQETTTEKTTSKPQTTTEKTTTAEPATTTAEPTTNEQTTTTAAQTTTTKQTTAQTTTTEQTTSEQTTTTTAQTTTTEQTTSEQTTTAQTTTTEQTTSEQTTTAQTTTTEQTTAAQTTTTEQTTSEPTTSEQTTTPVEETTTQSSTTTEHTTIAQTTEQATTTEDATTQQSTTTEQSTSTTENESQETTTNSQTTTEGSTTVEDTTKEQTTTTESGVEPSSTESAQETTTESGTSSSDKCPETDDDQYLLVCPTSFRRHPKYCNQFYQCTEEDETNDPKIAVFTCPNNTIYDESKVQCVEENKAEKKCEGEMASRRRVKRLGITYKEHIVVTKDSHSCSVSGHMPFEKNSECSSAFLKCTKSKSGQLRGFVYQCPKNYIYWSISRRCEKKETVRGCKRSINDWNGRWEIPVEKNNVAW